jgi:hypothetical protein
VSFSISDERAAYRGKMGCTFSFHLCAYFVLRASALMRFDRKAALAANL